MTALTPQPGAGPGLPNAPKTLADLSADAVDLGGLLDGAWVLVDIDSPQARNAMLPILEAAKRLADELAHHLDRMHLGKGGET